MDTNLRRRLILYAALAVVMAILSFVRSGPAGAFHGFCLAVAFGVSYEIGLALMGMVAAANSARTQRGIAVSPVGQALPIIVFFGTLIVGMNLASYLLGLFR